MWDQNFQNLQAIRVDLDQAAQELADLGLLCLQKY